MVELMGRKKIRDVLDFLDYSELQKIKRDLEAGGFHLLKLVSEKINQIELQHKTFCSFCGHELNPSSIHNYTLVFGPFDFRKKASFCGTDCMQTFLSDLKSKNSLLPKF